ncbi:uncharacterized protein FTJAE_13804 [Fusarium tjaetaba]|uniref:HNH nuclease domain-containing protein n=1 Tax=Fusarium tjaetaba TaxID=1567544 RepID=A0A8H5QH54_9HYPO|nr:uncharacterized protein FTJAE_13804 [Fusarium tjaetaba]KAF5614048.1 hypothetical protein FTJAE_13804 [Fusarium tjaetaba]
MLQVKAVTDLSPLHEIPVHEMNARLDRIEVIEKKIAAMEPPWPTLNHIQFCYLMGMPLEDLRTVSNLGGFYVFNAIHGLGELTTHFFKRDKYTVLSPPPSTSPAPKDSAPSSTRSQRTQVPRTQSTIDECKRLDQYRCIVTGLANPEACHIVPFHWNQDRDHLEKTEKILKNVGFIVFDQQSSAANSTHKEIIEEVKSSDKPWNLLCLSPQLHTWWGRAYFGLKCYGAVLCEDDPNYSIISLQFVWMPSNVKAMATDHIDLRAQRNPSTALRAHLTHRYGDGPLSACTTKNCTQCRETLGVQCHDISNNRPVESGTIVKVKRLTKDRRLLEHVIKLQWSIICAAALSGGPLIGDDAVSSDSEEEEMGYWEEDGQEDSIDKVNEWLELQNSEDGASASSKLRVGYPKSV